MRCEVVSVTPQVAYEWMKKNARNRPVSDATVERYAESMKGGDWPLTGDPIRFSKEGKLIDGQHRLLACILANKPFTTLVVRGLHQNVFNKIDQGNKRTVAHAFGRDGKKHYATLAGAVRVVWCLETTGSARQGPRLTVDEAFAVLQRYPRLEVICDRVRQLYTAASPITPSEAAGYWGYTQQFHGSKADEFWSRILTGEDCQKGSAALLLRKSLIEAAIGGRQLGHTARNTYMIKAFNAHITGKVPRLLKWNATDDSVEFVK